MNTKLDDIVDGDSEVFGMLIVRLKSRIFLKGKNTTVTCKDFKYHSSFWIKSKQKLGGRKKVEVIHTRDE